MAVNIWSDVQDLVGGKENWPRYVIKGLWCSDYRYYDRLVLATFFFGNGIHIDVFCELLLFIKRGNVKSSVLKKLRDLYKKFEKGDFEYNSRRTYYDMILRRVVDLNGNFALDKFYKGEFNVAGVGVGNNFTCLL